MPEPKSATGQKPKPEKSHLGVNNKLHQDMQKVFNDFSHDKNIQDFKNAFTKASEALRKASGKQLKLETPQIPLNNVQNATLFLQEITKSAEKAIAAKEAQENNRREGPPPVPKRDDPPPRPSRDNYPVRVASSGTPVKSQQAKAPEPHSKAPQKASPPQNRRQMYIPQLNEVLASKERLKKGKEPIKAPPGERRKPTP